MIEKIQEVQEKNRIEFPILWQDEKELLFRVVNGQGRLHFSGNLEHKAIYPSLVFDGVPLIRFYTEQGEYWCPTCEQLVGAGYGLDKVEGFEVGKLSESWNEPFESLAISFEKLKPILGLLEDGFYRLTVRDMIPTDGKDRFFWNIGNEPVKRYGTQDSHGDAIANFLLPTQPPNRLNPERLDYYKGRADVMGLVLGLSNWYGALLDGHHKATQAAVEGRRLPCLVIEKGRYIHGSGESFGVLGYIEGNDNLIQEFAEKVASDLWMSSDYWNFGDLLVLSSLVGTEKELGYYEHRYDRVPVQWEMKEESFDQFQWPENLTDIVSKYPTTESLFRSMNQEKRRVGSGFEINSFLQRTILQEMMEADENSFFVKVFEELREDAKAILSPCCNKPFLYVDFNEFIEADLLMLSQADQKKDLRGKMVELCEGLAVVGYQEDEDIKGRRDDLWVEGICVPNETGMWPHVKWLLRLDQPEVKTVSEWRCDYAKLMAKQIEKQMKEYHGRG